MAKDKTTSGRPQLRLSDNDEVEKTVKTRQAPPPDDSMDIPEIPPAPPLTPRAKRIMWSMFAIVIGIPAVVTIIGAVTSPPLAAVPTGHILYLDSDQPSEKTTMLRGLYYVGPDGRQHQLLHEQEPQDVDAGAREWISEPAVSPDGSHVAFVKQLITLLDEKQEDDYQLWVADVTPSKPNPGHMLYDLTAAHVSSPTRLAWTPDGGSVVFLDGNQSYSLAVGAPGVATGTKPATIPPAVPLISRVIVAPPGEGNTRGVSNSALVAALPGNIFVSQPSKGGDITWSGQHIADVTASAVSPDGKQLAVTQDAAGPTIVITSSDGSRRVVTAKWGWSLFGRRRVTSLRWSPDGRYLGYTVSKPPVAEDEMFFMEVNSGAVHKLPYRCGPASWDWTR